MRFICILLCVVLSNSLYAEDGLVTISSKHSVTDTADKLVSVIDKKGLKLFARINHATNAEKNGLALRPTELVIFGNPKIGTPLMQCAQTMAIDLPQKILVWQDELGKTHITYNSPDYLRNRHNIDGCEKVLKKVAGALSKLTHAAAN